MKLETFFEKFDELADAPDAVAKMKECILELAVQGVLVEQDPNDEPATKLLQRLIRFKSLNPLIGRSGRSKEALPETAVQVERDGNSLPSGWVKTTIGEVLHVIRGASPRPKGDPQYFSMARTPYHWVKISDIRKHGQNGLLLDTDEFLTEAGMRKSVLLPKGTLVLTNSATIGIPIVLGIDGCCIHDGYLAFPNFPHELLSQKFLLYLFHTLKKHAERNARGLAQLNLNTDLVRSFPFGLPPLAEQRRIVSKVNELMALCRQLEVQQRERDTRHAALARASLARFTEAPTLSNLDFLFHPSYSISPANLRGAILSLAVRGKLVPQDSTDEPAEQSLVRLGLKATAYAPNSSGTDEGSTPPSWTHVRFEDVAAVTGGVTLGRKLDGRKTITLPYLRVANVKRGELDLNVIKKVTVEEDEVERYRLRDNDLLMTEGGDWDKVGRAAIWHDEIPICLHQNHIFRARMRSEEICPLWFVRYFNSLEGRSYFESASKQTTNLASINMRQVRNCPVPFPPLAEQRRIVAKVDDLMALVDVLETQLAASHATAANLLKALVAELTGADASTVPSGRSSP
jgi:type I restriction enzyme S subunit